MEGKRKDNDNGDAGALCHHHHRDDHFGEGWYWTQSISASSLVSWLFVYLFFCCLLFWPCECWCIWNLLLVVRHNSVCPANLVTPPPTPWWSLNGRGIQNACLHVIHASCYEFTSGPCLLISAPVCFWCSHCPASQSWCLVKKARSVPTTYQVLSQVPIPGKCQNRQTATLNSEVNFGFNCGFLTRKSMDFGKFLLILQHSAS